MKTRIFTIILSIVFCNSIVYSKRTSTYLFKAPCVTINSLTLDTIPDSIYTEVDKIPLFPGCEEKATYQHALNCSKRMFTNYFLDSVHYPQKALENEAEGLAVIKFTVDKMGFIHDAKIYRDPGYDLGEEALRLVKGMNNLPNRWTPGVLNGEVVNVSVKLEFPFEINKRKAKQDYSKHPTEVLKVDPDSDYKVFKVVERMPRFPGCEDEEGTNDDKRKCADEKMVDFIYRNLRYPADSRKQGIEGTVVTQFYVDIDGYLKNIKVLKSLANDLDQEAIRIIQSMNQMDEKWTPGRQRDREVIVMYTMPIKFKLQ